jgi:PKD repeat protein
MQKILYTLLLALTFYNVHGQPGFSKLFRGQVPFPITGNSKATLIKTVDAGHLAIYNVLDTASGSDLLLVKMDFMGNELWRKKIEVPVNSEIAHDAIQMPDSSILILCTYDEPGFIYDEETYLVRVDLNGNVINTHYVTNSGICCWDISDGRLQLDLQSNIMLTHQSYGISTYDGLVRVLDANNYNNIYGGTDGNVLYHAKAFQDADSSYISFGHEIVSGQKRAMLRKRNKLFTYLWQKFFRHSAAANNRQMKANDIIRVDSSYVMLMYFEDTAQQNNMYILKTNLNGDSITSVRFANENIPFGIHSLGSNGYVIATYSFINVTNISNYLELIKTDTAFNIVTRRQYRYKNFNEIMYSFKVSSDSCYLLAASSDSVSVRNIHVLKVKPDLCVDAAPSFTSGYTTLYGNTQPSVLITNTSDYGIIDSLGTTTTINFGDGSPMVSLTSDTISHPYPTQGTYIITLTITNSCGTFIFAQPVVVTCPGLANSFNYTENLLSVNFVYSATAPSYNWNFGDGNISTLQNPLHTYALPGTYYVCLTTTNACGTISICDSITVECTAPVISLLPNYYACNGTTITLDAGTNGTGYLWSNGQTLQQINVTTSNTYAVTVTNVCGAASTASANVTFSALPQIDIGSDTIICQNDLMQVTNLSPSGTYNYQWYINNQLQSTGTTLYFSQSLLGLYEVTVIADNNGCLDSAKRNFTVSPALFCDTATYCTPVYSSGTVQGDYIKQVSISGGFSNITGGTGQPAYMDYTNLTAVLYAGQNPTITLEFNEINPMYYRIWVDYNQNGVFEPSEVLSQNAVNPGVTTINTNISANAYGGPTRMRVRCASHTSTNIDPCLSYNFGQTEDYTIIIQNGNGAPIARFTADTMHINVNDVVNFTDLSYNNPTQWEWIFDGAQTSSSSVQNPANILYPTAGCYPVTLKASNANGMGMRSDTCYIWVDPTLGLSNNDWRGFVQIQPNPIGELVTLHYKIASEAIVRFYDITGREVAFTQLTGTENKKTISLAHLAEGVYYVSMYAGEKLLLTEKVIKLKP